MNPVRPENAAKLCPNDIFRNAQATRIDSRDELCRLIRSTGCRRAPEQGPITHSAANITNKAGPMSHVFPIILREEHATSNYRVNLHGGRPRIFEKACRDQVAPITHLTLTNHRLQVGIFMASVMFLRPTQGAFKGVVNHLFFYQGIILRVQGLVARHRAIIPRPRRRFRKLPFNVLRAVNVLRRLVTTFFFLSNRRHMTRHFFPSFFRASQAYARTATFLHVPARHKGNCHLRGSIYHLTFRIGEGAAIFNASTHGRSSFLIEQDRGSTIHGQRLPKVSRDHASRTRRARTRAGAPRPSFRPRACDLFWRCRSVHELFASAESSPPSAWEHVATTPRFAFGIPGEYSLRSLPNSVLLPRHLPPSAPASGLPPSTPTQRIT